MEGGKTKLTISIDRNALANAKKAAMDKRVSISGLVENFLVFFSNPWAYCFKCGDKFSTADADVCPKCGWLRCPKCKVCRCGLDENTAVAVFHMRRACRDLLVEG